MCERFDFIVAQRIGDVGHHRLAAGTHARFVIAQRLQKIILALGGEAGHRLGTSKIVGMA